ncbi:MAG: hypothetical protein GX568_10360 [Candidatus Gastranaerophilales bacterium]|nr:hypothetical protein [Candidatus Gastranaerophilales bacterium]
MKINFEKVHIYLVFFLYALVFALIDTDADVDLWHRLALGRIFAQLGGVINHDIFAYFPQVNSWIDHEWLSGVVFYQLSHLFGDAGIITLKILIIFAIVSLMYHAGQLIAPDGEKRVLYYLLAVFSIMPGLSSTLRCQAFTYLFFTLWIFLLERIKKDRDGSANRLIWIFPATMLAWTNLHGGFLAGVGLVFLFMLGELLNRQKPFKYLLILLACLPTTLITPYGLARFPQLSNFFHDLSLDRSAFPEWQPMQLFGDVDDFLIYKIVVLLFFAVLMYKLIWDRKRIDWTELLLPCTLFALSLAAKRHLVFFTITAIIYCYKHYSAFIRYASSKITSYTQRIFEQDLRDKAIFMAKAFFYVFITGFCVMLLANNSFSITLDYYPTKALEFIRINNLRGNLFVQLNWGSYAMWKMYPYNFVSSDGRYEFIYTHQAYIDAYNLSYIKSISDWRDSFHTYHHDVLLVDKKGLMQQKFSTLIDWKQVYEDEKAIIFVPASLPDREWMLPEADDAYYIKTKYENDITF